MISSPYYHRQKEFILQAIPSLKICFVTQLLKNVFIIIEFYSQKCLVEISKLKKCGSTNRSMKKYQNNFRRKTFQDENTIALLPTTL